MAGRMLWWSAAAVEGTCSTGGVRGGGGVGQNHLVEKLLEGGAHRIGGGYNDEDSNFDGFGGGT
jgi:hypothetical protein